MNYNKIENSHSALEGLPSTFDVTNSIDNSKLRIQLLHPVPHQNICGFTPRAISHKKTVIVRPETAVILNGCSNYIVKQFDELGNFLEYAYLTRSGNAFCIIDMGRDPENIPQIGDENDNYEDEPSKFGDISDFIHTWLYEPIVDPSKSERLPLFNMKPPVAQLAPSKAENIMISPQSEANPLNFLLSRYYNTLYSLTTPLSYFPKTALARFKIMCGNDRNVMKSNLLSVYLTTEQLEERYNGNFGLDKVLNLQTQKPTSSSTEYEAKSRENFVSKHLSNSSNEKLIRKLVLELKIREAHLQILVLMELVLCWPIDEEQFLTEMAKKQAKMASKNQKQSLVRRKGNKKKIVPTFLGIGIQEFAQSPEKPANKSVDELTLYTSLIALVDQMGIWETLLGRMKGEKDGLMYGFLAYVLVPFFNNQLPHIVSFIIQKVKELRPKLEIPKAKKQKLKLKQPESTEMESVPTVDDNEEVPKKTSRFAKVLLSPHQKPFLSRAATTGSELEPAFSLKRSKSNLGLRNLKRRQVDMSVANNELEEAKKSKLFLFGDARRIKSVSSSAALSQITQVEATPMKKSHSMSNATLLPPPKSQVLATPSNVRVVDMQQQIFETPIVERDLGFAKPAAKGSSVQEKLAKLAPLNALMNITSSPVRELSDNAPNLFSRSSNAESSPHFAVTSSPVMPLSAQRGKPGEPITLSNSPFFRSHLDGLPPSKNDLGIFKSRKLVKRKNQNKSPVSTRNHGKILGNMDNLTNKGKQSTFIDSESTTDMISLASKLQNTFADSQVHKTSQPFVIAHSVAPIHVHTDTDLDSDYDRLLLSVPRPATRKYSRK